MSFARPWWLAALVLLLPLVLLHLRRPALAVREVASLAIWERLAAPVESSDWRLRRPRHPLLLALQALALCALLIALAGPARPHAAPPPTTVFVVDGSLWMHVGTRLADARTGVGQLAGSDPKANVALVTAAGTPAVAYRGPVTGLPAALDGLQAGAGEGDLSAGIALAAGLLGDREGRMVVLRAPEDAIPELAAAQGQVTVRVVGSPSADQGLFARGARCGVGPAGLCEVVATVRNGDAVSHVDGYAAYLDGKRTLTLPVTVPAHGTSTVTLTARPGSSVRLQLTKRDALPLDDTAWFTVPSAAGTPASLRVTLVGDPDTAKPLAQALAAAPGVSLELRTSKTYRRQDALASDLVVLDGWVPSDGLPPAPAVALIAPTRIPGGLVGAPLPGASVSSTAAGNDLIAGVDLRSLSVDRNAARQLRLPTWLDPILSSPGGTLLAAGDNGRQRLAVLAFDPARSNLTQLPAFPILARNLERWAAGWTSAGENGSLAIDAVPGATNASVTRDGGESSSSLLRGRPVGITGLAPGAYTVVATGPDVAHRSSLTATLPVPGTAENPASGPIDLRPWARLATPREQSSLSPYLIILALMAIAGEWAVWRRLRRRT
ncbi:MAG TPA: VWA domain-containing protein [Gaiellales bacterium]|nr:VWA domain-containing protein [Gaiellales bacterium]